MKIVTFHKPANKLERLLLLYCKINQESADYGFYYEKSNNYILEKELEVSRLTVDRYVNILIDTSRVFIENEDEWGYYLRNNVFSNLNEICDFIHIKEMEWSDNGNLTAEKKRLLHLIRLIGWMDFFYVHGKISEMEINEYYSGLTKKRKMLRDFKILRELENIYLNIDREYLISINNEKKWYYVVK